IDSCNLYVWSLIRQPPPRLTLFPYTTLFRSRAGARAQGGRQRAAAPAPQRPAQGARRPRRPGDDRGAPEARCRRRRARLLRRGRSEEHTSELQSREKLVCRLLLEKKKRYRYY